MLGVRFIEDTGLILAVGGIMLAAASGVAGILWKGRRGAALTFVVLGGTVGIAGTLKDRYDADSDRRQLRSSLSQLQTSLRSSLALESDLRSAVQITGRDLAKKADATLATAKSLNSKSRSILNAVNQNLNTTRFVGEQTTKVGALTGANARETEVIGRDTRWASVRAGRLQTAAAQSLHGIQELTTRFGDVEAVYEVDIPLADPRLQSLKASIVALLPSRASQPVTYAGVVPLVDLLSRLPVNDSSRAFLDGLDLEVEMYRPPFPTQPYYGDSSRSHFPAGQSVDFDLQTTAMRSLPSILRNSSGRVPYGVQWTARWDGSWHLLSAFLSGFEVPMTRGGRTGRLDSIADLPGSFILIHLIPDFFFPILPNSVPLAQVTGVALNIDGAHRRFSLDKAHKGAAPLFNYYEISVPNNWPVNRYFIP